MEALVYRNHPRAAPVSSYLAIIFGRIASGVRWLVPPLNCGANAALASVLAQVEAVVALKSVFDIRSLK